MSSASGKHRYDLRHGLWTIECVSGFSQVLNALESHDSYLFFVFFVFCNCSVAVVKRTVMGSCTGNVINRLSEGYPKGHILTNTHNPSEIPAREIRIESI